VIHGVNIEIKNRQKQAPPRKLLFNSMPPLEKYNCDLEQVFCPNRYDQYYSNVIEKVLGRTSEPMIN
jgi:hypothetical protein